MQAGYNIAKLATIMANVLCWKFLWLPFSQLMCSVGHYTATIFAANWLHYIMFKIYVEVNCIAVKLCYDKLMHPLLYTIYADEV